MLPVYITVLNLEILTSPVFYYTIAKNLNTYIVVNINFYYINVWVSTLDLHLQNRS